MPRKPQTSGEDREKIIDAALQLAGERSPASVSMAAIAAAAEVSLGTLYRVFPSRLAILCAALRRVNTAVLDAGAAEGGCGRDRLFDVLMRRFDALAPAKPAMRRLCPKSCLPRAEAVMLSLPLAVHLEHAMRWSLEAAGIRATGIAGAMRVKLLAVAYLAALRVWLYDDEADLAVTMAALDRALRRIEPLLRIDDDEPPRPAAPVPTV